MARAAWLNLCRKAHSSVAKIEPDLAESGSDRAGAMAHLLLGQLA
jgi:hypothetical protein